MRTSRIAIGYSLINYNDVIELMGNSAITAAGYSFQKISKCLNGKKLSTGGRVWVLNQLTFKDWEQKVSAAVVNKKFELKVTESEVIERIKDTKIRLVPGTYQGTRKKAFFDCVGNVDHRWSTTPDHVFRGQGCPTCANSKPLSVEEVYKVGFEAGWVLDQNTFKGLKYKARWWCLKHNRIFLKNPEKILYRNSGCIICGRERIAASNTRDIEEIRKILLTRQIDFLDSKKYIGTNEPAEFKCLRDPTHPSWRTSTQHLITENNPTACPTCAGKKQVTLVELNERLKNKNIEVVQSSFIGGMQSKATFRCLAGLGHENWTTSVNNVYSNHINSGCPACAERGFNPSERGYFYITKLYNKEFGEAFGFGITNQWSRRWKTHKKNLSANAIAWDEPLVFEFESGYDCRSLETSVKEFLKSQNKNINLNVEGFISEAGFLEAYSDVLSLITSFRPNRV